MQERAALVGATLEIESAAGKGTTILVRMAATAPAQTQSVMGERTKKSTPDVMACERACPATC